MRILNWKNLLIKICLYTSCLLSLFIQSFGQSLIQIDSISTNRIDQVSIDRQGNLYLCDEDGLIFKYSPEGKLLVNYSPTKKGRITQIEAWQGLRVIVYYADFQEFVLMDRFLRAAEPYQLSSNEIGFGRTGTLSNDDNVWIVDDSDYSLKKIDVRRRTLSQNNNFSFLLPDQDTQLNFIREYKNLLYLNDWNSGILVFDNLGNYLNKIPIPGLEYYNFWEDELYYLETGSIKFHNLYTGAIREIRFHQDGDERFQFVLISQDRLFLIAPDYFKIFRLS